MIRTVRSLFASAGKKKPVQKPSPFFKQTRFLLEALEDRTVPAVAMAYVNQAWTGLANGSPIADADPTIIGNQSAIIGSNAFAGLNGGIGAVQSGGAVTLSPGTYGENVTMTVPFHLVVLPGQATISGVISGPAPLQLGKAGLAGDGTLTLSGVNTYLGETIVTRGHLRISSDSQLGAPKNDNNGGLNGLYVTAPGSVGIADTMTTSRAIFLNNSATLQVDSGKILGLSGGEINGGVLAGPGTIETIDQSTTYFQGGRTTSSLILNANAETSFISFENGGTLNLAAAKTFTLTVFSNLLLGKMLVSGTANVTDFVSNGQIAVAPTGKIVNVGTSQLVFGGGSRTTVNRLGPIDNIDDGLIDLGPQSATMYGGLMTNHGLVGSFTPGVSLEVNYGSVASGTGIYSSVVTKAGGRYSAGSSAPNNEAVISGVTSGRVQQNATLIANGSLTVIDADLGESRFQAAEGTTAYGSYTVSPFGDWVYALSNNNPSVLALAPSETLIDSFAVLSVDGTSKLVTITISDASAPPIIPTAIGGDTSGSILIDGLLTVHGTLTVTDPDPGEASFQAVTTLTPYGIFTLSADGEWSYTVDINRPALSQLLAVNPTVNEGLKVRTFDGTSTNVWITISGVNDAPVFTQSNYAMTFDVAAPQIIGSVHAINTDRAEAFQVMTYAIASGNEVGAFSINASTGAVTYKGQDCCGAGNLDQDFELIVSATDNGFPSKSATSTVSVRRRPR